MSSPSFIFQMRAASSLFATGAGATWERLPISCGAVTVSASNVFFYLRICGYPSLANAPAPSCGEVIWQIDCWFLRDVFPRVPIPTYDKMSFPVFPDVSDNPLHSVLFCTDHPSFTFPLFSASEPKFCLPVLIRSGVGRSSFSSLTSRFLNLRAWWASMVTSQCMLIPLSPWKFD